jgi:hypothetical protein
MVSLNWTMLLTIHWPQWRWYCVTLRNLILDRCPWYGFTTVLLHTPTVTCRKLHICSLISCFGLFIIIIGLTALRGPLPSSEASASFHLAIASSDFMTTVFSRMGLSAPRPTPGYPGGPMSSVGVVALSWLVPVLKHQELAFCPCIT